MTRGAAEDAGDAGSVALVFLAEYEGRGDETFATRCRGHGKHGCGLLGVGFVCGDLVVILRWRVAL